MTSRTSLRAALRTVSTRPFPTARQSFRPARTYATEAPKSSSTSQGLLWGALGAIAAGGAYYAYSQSQRPPGAAQDTSAPEPPARGYSAKPKDAAPPTELDYQKVYNAIADVLDAEYDDGSYGPVLLRLAWHCSGTYDKETGSGGSNGATMRFAPEANHGANAGLHHARNRLEPIKERFPAITYSDLWTLAGVCAVAEMGGPKVPWRPGRQDGLVEHCTPDGRLPDGDKGSDHIRKIFNRQGFNDQEIVALSGAHALGRCHADRSGFEGPWTFSPITFTNDYYRLLFDEKWQLKKWKGPIQYEDKTTKSLMMLTTDMALTTDKSFRKHAEVYAKDQDTFFRDFAAAFGKMLENGVPVANFKSEPMLLKTSDEAVA